MKALTEGESVELSMKLFDSFGLELEGKPKVETCFGHLPERFGDKSAEFATLELKVKNVPSHRVSFSNLLENLKLIERFTGWESEGFTIENGWMLLSFDNYNYLDKVCR